MHAFNIVIKSSHSKDLAFFAPEIEHNSLPSHTPTALKLKTYNTNLYLVAKNIYLSVYLLNTKKNLRISISNNNREMASTNNEPVTYF